MSGRTPVSCAAASPFSGSYDASDVTFLLHPVSPATAERLYEEPEHKERLIQGGQRHYSEMITPERVPEADYQQIFEQALVRHTGRMGAEVAQLVVDLDARISGPITLCSLVRAGVPLGVLLLRGLRALGRDVEHFGVSIIRDRGIDGVAMGHVLQARPPAGVVFVDGWTGKGAIADELERSVAAGGLARHAAEATPLDTGSAQHETLCSQGQLPRLVVLADPAGRAWLSAGVEDWLIPSGILGGTVSGLVSRSILNASLTSPDDFHATVWLDYLIEHDVSRRFVDCVGTEMLARLPSARSSSVPESERRRQAARATASAVIDRVAAEFSIANRNRIKPGIAEATRAVLRRSPARILVAGLADPDLEGLRHLAQRAGVVVESQGCRLFPYRAITIIADATDATARADSIRGDRVVGRDSE